MRWLGLPVVVAAIVLLLGDESHAQNRLRFVGVAGATGPRSVAKQPVAKPAEGPKLQLTSQIVQEGPVAVGEENSYSQDAVTAGYMPAEASAGMAAGCAFAPFGGYGYGYNPDFGAGPNGMSVWPGVPACCDPWFGYCGEPRCYKCNCHQGTFQYYHCPKGACQPEILTWQRGDWADKSCQPAGACCGQGCAANQAPCANCHGASYTPSVAPGMSGADEIRVQDSPSSVGPAVQPEPVAAPRPRNDLPKRPAGPSARRTASSAAK